MEIKDDSIIEIYSRTISVFGGSSHVILPKKLKGKYCKVIVLKTGFFND